jgi:hypothetical protein
VYHYSLSRRDDHDAGLHRRTKLPLLLMYLVSIFGGGGFRGHSRARLLRITMQRQQMSVREHSKE